MRIAIVINTSWNIYNFRMGIIRALLENQQEVICIAPKDDFSYKLEEAGCKFVPLIMQNKGSNPLKDYDLMKQLKAIYQQEKLDVILHYTIKPNIYGTIAAYKLGIPCVNNVSGLGTVFIRKNIVSTIAKRLYKYSFKKATKIFFQNEDDRRLFVKNKLVNNSITDLLPGSGIDLEKFKFQKFQKGDPFVFLVISRILVDKGIVEYLQAAKKLKQKGLKAEFQIIGFKDSSSLGVTEEVFNQYIEDGSVKYLGTTSDIASFIKKSDCIVLPSYREGTPRALLEGAVMGKPLIATDVPGCREVVFHEFNGYTCQVKDSQDLADKMEAMYDLSAQELSNFGQHSRLLVEEKFDEKIVINKYIEAIEEVTSQKIKQEATT